MPREVEILAETIDAHLPEGARRCVERVAAALSESVDLSLVWPRFACEMLEDLLTLAEVQAVPDTRDAVDRVRGLYARMVSGSTVGPEEWVAPQSTAQTSSWASSWVAAESAAWAAWAVTESAAWAVSWAASAAAMASSWAALEAPWPRFADRLIRLLEEAGRGVTRVTLLEVAAE